MPVKFTKTPLVGLAAWRPFSLRGQTHQSRQPRPLATNRDAYSQCPRLCHAPPFANKRIPICFVTFLTHTQRDEELKMPCWALCHIFEYVTGRVQDRTMRSRAFARLEPGFSSAQPFLVNWTTPSVLSFLRCRANASGLMSSIPHRSVG